MNQIFNYIFNIVSSIINFLDFSLPGISLTFLDFVLLSILIPVLFKFAKGSFDELGFSSSMFGEFNSSISNYKSLANRNYANSYEGYKERKIRNSVYSDRFSNDLEESEFGIRFGHPESDTNITPLIKKYSKHK